MALSTSPKHISRRNSHRHRKAGAVKAILIIFLCLLVIAGFWFLSQLGPRDVDYATLQSDRKELTPEVLALQEESIRLEAEFEEILTIRDPVPEDIALFKQALEKQVAFLNSVDRVDSAAYSRKVQMEERYQNLASARLFEESLAAEQKAESLSASREYTEARDLYVTAFEKQDIINEEFPLSDAYNVSRLTRLDRQARYLAAEPIFQKSLEFEKEADAAIEAADWPAAQSALTEAMKLQDQLNREFRGTNQASVARHERLRIKQVGIESGRDNVKIVETVRLADKARAGGDQLLAAEYYRDAARMQAALNEEFPDSPYASSEKVSNLERKSQTAESYELGRRIERDIDEVEALLASGDTFRAIELIVGLRADVDQMQASYPRSLLNDPDLQQKVRYLNLIKDDIGFIQERINDALLPIPEVADWRMLRSEVSQALYSVIMGTNPSRNQGDERPVDSVSWKEAKQFCERLGWILGTEVRLPTENEFRNALGKLRYVVLEDRVWSAENTDRTSRPIARKEPFVNGFYDLLGNVSEWLESVDRFESEDARHIGGSAQDRLDAIFSVPLRDAGRSERNRLIGFRVVVKQI